MKKWVFLLAVFCSTGYGLLPPLAQSIREIEAILADPRLYQFLGSQEWVQGIERTGDGYVVLGSDHLVFVTVTYLPAGRPGPARFSLYFSDTL